MARVRNLCPEDAHWVVKRLFRIIEKEQISISLLGRKSGVQREAIASWRYAGNPKLMSIEACLNALGYEFRIVSIKEEECQV